MNLLIVILQTGLIVLPLLATRRLSASRLPRPVFWLAAIPLVMVSQAALVSVYWWWRDELGGMTLFLDKVLVALVELVILAYFLRIYPNRLLVYLALVPALLSIGLLFGEALRIPVFVIDALLAALALGDLLTLPGGGTFQAERHCGRIASLKKDHPVSLTISNLSRRSQFVWIRDGVPTEMTGKPDEFVRRLEPRSRVTVEYHLNARRRGSYALPTVFLRVRSRLGMWNRHFSYPVSTQVFVYPDMKQLAEYALLARTNRLNLLGVRRTRKIGQDNEFERLRDYTRDDNYKHIDWRSTARRQKLTVKDFQANQSQRLIFMLDCGRMMTNEASGLTLLDHSLNAMLMLAYVALSHGDAVGLLCFSDEIHLFIPPASGMRQMNRLLHGSFDRFPRLVESRYDQAFLYLAANSRKRSLVVLMSNVIDEVNANQVHRYLSNMVGKHLPLGVLLRDRRLFELADLPNPEGEALFRAGAAAEILCWRHQVLADLGSSGVLSLDVFPEDLTAPLVNRYLDIKARHLL